MPTKRSRLTKSVFLALLWLSGQIPSDLLLLHRVPDTGAIQAFSLMLQMAEMFAVAYLVYRVISMHRVQVQTCPVCNGYGKRYYARGNPELNRTAEKCGACHGTCVVYVPVFAEVEG